jgi:probable addiction module antidote protein
MGMKVLPNNTHMAGTADKTRTIPYDVAEQLCSPDEMAAYLNAWLEEAPDDTAGFVRALGDIVRSRGLSQVARDAGLRQESLDKLSENGNPSFATVLKVARALGVRLHADAS